VKRKISEDLEIWKVEVWKVEVWGIE